MLPEFLPGVKRPGSDFDGDLHLVPRLRMSGAIPLPPLHTFMALTRSTLPLTFTLEPRLILDLSDKYLLAERSIAVLALPRCIT